MKFEKFKVFKVIFICVCCGIIFAGMGYFYLNESIRKTENSAPKEPYSPPVPHSCGVLLNISGDYTFFYLDFDDMRLSVMLPEKITEKTDEIYGYPVDYRVSADYELAAGMIDYVGGIDRQIEKKTLRYTGVQVTQLLRLNTDTAEQKRWIIPAVLKKISDNGLDKKFFSYIIENSETDLTIPGCYYWAEYMSKLCSAGKIIN